jgi:hypothetical protein
MKIPLTYESEKQILKVKVREGIQRPDKSENKEAISAERNHADGQGYNAETQNGT